MRHKRSKCSSAVGRWVAVSPSQEMERHHQSHPRQSQVFLPAECFHLSSQISLYLIEVNRSKYCVRFTCALARDVSRKFYSFE